MSDTEKVTESPKKPQPSLDYYGKLEKLVSSEALAAIRKSGHGFYDKSGDGRLTIIMLGEVLQELKTLNAGIAMLNLRGMVGENAKTAPTKPLPGTPIATVKS